MRFGGDWIPQSSSENMTGFLGNNYMSICCVSFEQTCCRCIEGVLTSEVSLAPKDLSLFCFGIGEDPGHFLATCGGGGIVMIQPS